VFHNNLVHLNLNHSPPNLILRLRPLRNPLHDIAVHREIQVDHLENAVVKEKLLLPTKPTKTIKEAGLNSIAPPPPSTQDPVRMFNKYGILDNEEAEDDTQYNSS